jgi:hypothetical protein
VGDHYVKLCVTVRVTLREPVSATSCAAVSDIRPGSDLASGDMRLGPGASSGPTEVLAQAAGSPTFPNGRPHPCGACVSSGGMSVTGVSAGICACESPALSSCCADRGQRIVRGLQGRAWEWLPCSPSVAA